MPQTPPPYTPPDLSLSQQMTVIIFKWGVTGQDKRQKSIFEAPVAWFWNLVDGHYALEKYM